jgi:hypothetical protein
MKLYCTKEPLAAYTFVSMLRWDFTVNCLYKLTYVSCVLCMDDILFFLTVKGFCVLYRIVKNYFIHICSSSQIIQIHLRL